MLSAFGPVCFTKADGADGLVSTTLFYGVMNRIADDAAAVRPDDPPSAVAASAVDDAGGAAASVPESAAAMVADEAVEDDDEDDEEEEEEEEEAAAATPAAPPASAGAADGTAAAAVPASAPVAESGPAPPDSYDDQWFSLDRAAELLTDVDQTNTLVQAVRVLQLVAKVDRTPLSLPDLRWPELAAATSTAVAARTASTMVSELVSRKAVIRVAFRMLSE